MGNDLLRVDRGSRIHLRGRFIDYPLRLTQATRAFGAGNAVRGGLSYPGAAVASPPSRSARRTRLGRGGVRPLEADTARWA
jgi:hypothetical protein